MWKDVFAGYLKHSRSSGLSVRLSALIAALLLSLLCGLFYNAWKYEVERIVLDEGGWQSRLSGEIGPDAMASIKNYANVKDAVVNGKDGGEGSVVTELYFYDYHTVFSDTPRIAKLAGITPEQVDYHYGLLAMYLVRSENDPSPRLLFPLLLMITLLACFSLIVIIHNAFAVSMHARVHQFGILSSVGATPGQIRWCLLKEAAALCTAPVLAGNLLGIAGSIGLVQLSNLVLGNSPAGRHPASAGYHPLVLLLTLLVTAVTIFISAWLPARKLSRLTPLEAIRNTGELQLKRRRKPGVLALAAGVEGELAANALKAQSKALRTASLSLICSFLAFTVMQCFFTTSQISTRETYFERYQDAWDIMVTVRNAAVDTFEQTEAVQALPGVKSAVVYQKAEAKRIVAEDEISEEMKSCGGFSHASGGDVSKAEGGWLVHAPLVILDDHSFAEYCRQIGITPRLDGAVVRNQIRDVTNPDFRHPVFMPYLNVQAAKGDAAGSRKLSDGKGDAASVFGLSDGKEDAASVFGPSDGKEDAVSILRPSDGEDLTAELPVLSYTAEVPVLREEYATQDYYELVHFLPASLWKEIKGKIGAAQEDLFIRVLGEENASLEELCTVQSRIGRLLGGKHPFESTNRIQEYETNRRQIQGMQAIFGGFCVLLAMIGIGDVFSNTLGFVRQRKREFARYLSIGMTPKELRKMFCLEALALAGRPILITLPFSVFAVGYMLKISYLEAGEFLEQAPLVPIGIFMLAVTGSVALAYALAWRSMRSISLAQVLRDDTMM